ncbi:MAG: AMP-binding protein [Anaerolineae bacterium]
MRPSAPDSILHLFAASVERAPDAPCLIWQGQPIRYDTVHTAATRVGRWLRDQGLASGERVALALDSSPAFVYAYLGVGLAGGVVVLVNAQYRPAELTHLLSDSGAALVLGHGPILDAIRALQPDLPALRQAHDFALGAGPLAPGSGAAEPLALPRPDDLALLAYTSGTTGRSKGAMLSHANLAANITAVTQAWRWTAADRLLLTLPLFHIHGLGVGLHGALITGASADLRPRFDPAEVIAALDAGGISLFFGVPTMYARLLAAARNAPPRTTGVRLFVSGSAPLSPEVFDEFQRVFGQTLLERYGMTETGMLTTNPLDGPRRPGAVGQPFPGQAILVGAPGAPLPPYQVGAVWTRGPNVFQGYWQQPDATAEVFRDGWFNTGDLGFLDDTGVLTLVGRSKELIISGGFNVYPREVEEMLQTHPAVVEAAVVGLPDPDLGERVVAVVVPRSPAPSADELMEYCRARLAPYKKPREVRFVAALPRNAMGKIQKTVILADLMK